jgi:hypothetical protein
MTISYRRKNGKLHARLFMFKTIKNKSRRVYDHLGLVLSKKKGIYKNHTRGVFTYNEGDHTYGIVPNSLAKYQHHPEREDFILDFGDVYLLEKIIENTALKDVIDGIDCVNPDSLNSMICYYALNFGDISLANSWWEGSYARILYPNAELSRENILVLLEQIGDESVLNRFFDTYLERFGGKTANILMANMYPTNCIPQTEISDLSGNIIKEARLIYATDDMTGQPIYFGHSTDYLEDATIFVKTRQKLKARKIKVALSILDPDYYSEKNIRQPYLNKIEFLYRISKKALNYEDLKSLYLNIHEQTAELVPYEDSYFYITRFPCEFLNRYPGYTYLVLDLEARGDEIRNLFPKGSVEGIDKTKVCEIMSKKGVIALFSSSPLYLSEILDVCFKDRTVEEVFHAEKKHISLAPLEIYKEPVFIGHLLLSFIAEVLLKTMERTLKKSTFNPASFFRDMKNQKCMVYGDQILTNKPTEKINDSYKLFGVICPVEIDIMP